MTIYFEDIEVGEVHEFGSYEVTEAEILEFAERYDPQPFHVDPAAASESIYGGLIASGWHTAAMCMRLLVENFVNETASLGSPGIDELRFHAPVRPGDTLSVRLEILDKEGSESKPDRGLVRLSVDALVDAEPVLTMKPLAMVGRRDEPD